VARDRHPAVASSFVVSGRGVGAVMATESYEESLSAEGIPVIQNVGFHEAAWTMASAASISSDPHQPCEEQDVRPGCSAHEGERGVRMNTSKSRHGCQRLGCTQRRGNNTPTS